MRRSGVALAAAVVLMAEGVALGVVSLLELFALTSGRASSTPTGAALVVLTLIGAAALVAFGFGVLRGVSWARSGGILFQVIAIALALSSLSLQPVPWTFTLGLGVAGVAGLVLLILTARREGGSDPRTHRPDAD
ncbi:hypothetical protein [Microbacterium istanbulense]|uniref:Integral membrane protein n=1 Tax=Microbacterium istanbulense TaxID=3122049 RepID=A0ABU8LIK0_9MICO